MDLVSAFDQAEEFSVQNSAGGIMVVRYRMFHKKMQELAEAERKAQQPQGGNLLLPERVQSAFGPD